MSNEEGRLVGTVVDGRYRVERLIAVGGFSEVYRGVDTKTNTPIALKVLHIDQEVEANWLERFTREAQVVSRLESPNTVRILGWGQIGSEFLYTVMEYIAGRSLFRQIRRHGAMTPRQVAEVATQVCDSLIEAHEAGFLHRDLKPSNIMLFRNDDGKVIVKVLDFGVVKILDPGPEFELQLTQQGTFVGTPRYASPEQLRREPLTAAADVYGVGMIMWEALVGDPAIADPEYSACVKAHLRRDPWRIPEWVDSPPEFSAIVEKSLAKRVNRRYQSCTELKAALDGWLESRDRAKSKRKRRDVERKPASRRRTSNPRNTSKPSTGGKSVSNNDDLSKEDLEAEDELFGGMIEESDAVENVDVMQRHDLSESSAAKASRKQIAKRHSDHAGIEDADRPTAHASEGESKSNVGLTILLLVVVVAGALYVLTMGGDEPEPTGDATATGTEETTDEAPPQASEEPAPEPDDERAGGVPTLDADTISKGLVASGWRLSSKSTDKMDEVTQTNALATKGDMASSITIYESRTWDWADKLYADTEPPTKVIRFGRTIVRLNSGPDYKQNGAVEAHAALAELRTQARQRAEGEGGARKEADVPAEETEPESTE